MDMRDGFKGTAVRRAIRAAIGAGGAALAVVAAGCGSSGPKPVFSPPQEGTVVTVREQRMDGSQGGSRPMQFQGRQEVAGGTFDRLTVGFLDREQRDGEVWFVDFGGDVLTFAGGEVYYPSSPDPSIPGATATVAEPIAIDLDPPVGVPQVVPVLGTVVLGNPSSPDLTVDVDTPLTYTLVDPAETVATAMGDVPGTRHYAASATILDLPAEADVWLLDGVGVVKATYTWQGANGPAGFSIESLIAAQAERNGFATTRKDALIGPGQTGFHLSTVDRANAVDVDKDVHAKQFLELRWADDARAQTSERPPVDFLFAAGAFAYFPAYLVESTVSLFHTNEAGAGYHYWVAAVDQASKNSSIQPTAYGINVTYEPSTVNETGAVRVSASIHYKVYAP